MTRSAPIARRLQAAPATGASPVSTGSPQRATATLPRRSIAIVVGLLLVIGLARWTLVDAVSVTSDSMAPTVCTGGVVLLATGKPHDVRVDDIVTFDSPVDQSTTIKRVVGLAGQTVAIEDARLVVDGKLVDEPYVDHETIDGVYYGPVTVPAGTVLVMGDHRETSVDSRAYGPVPLSEIRGRGIATLWSSCPG